MFTFEDQYTLQWIDDENALVIFQDSGTMFKALQVSQFSTLAGGGD